MDWDDLAPKPKKGITLGEDLKSLSVSELEARIAALEGEIARVEGRDRRQEGARGGCFGRLQALSNCRDKMSSRALSAAAAAAAGLVFVTLATAYSRRGTVDSLLAPHRVASQVEPMPETTARCAIFHARFGGPRADLVKVMRGGVANYVVLEVGRRDPLLKQQRGAWLRGAYGDGEQIWLGAYSSSDAAMREAARLCPPMLRCWPGDADCVSREEMLTPARAFQQL